MSQTLILMNIKDVKMLIKLFNGCTFENGKFTNGRGQPLYGEPFIMTNRGPDKKDIYVMMAWSPNNVSECTRMNYSHSYRMLWSRTFLFQLHHNNYF